LLLQRNPWRCRTNIIASVGSVVSTRTTYLLTRTPQVEQLSYPSAMTPAVPNIKPPILAPDGARGLASPVAYRGTRVGLHQAQWALIISNVHKLSQGITGRLWPFFRLHSQYFLDTSHTSPTLSTVLPSLWITELPSSQVRFSRFCPYHVIHFVLRLVMGYNSR